MTIVIATDTVLSKTTLDERDLRYLNQYCDIGITMHDVMSDWQAILVIIFAFLDTHGYDVPVAYSIIKELVEPVRDYCRTGGLGDPIRKLKIAILDNKYLLVEG